MSADNVVNSPTVLDALFLEALKSDIAASGFQVDQELVHRFVASLVTKRFVILTGLSGSGKTKLAQILASWLTPISARQDKRQPLIGRAGISTTQWFQLGAELPTGRASYRVDAIDSLAVQFSNERAGNERIKVTLPRELIEEWVTAIRLNGFTRETRVRTIRETVAQTTEYSTQLNSFETHLRAAAFALIEQEEGKSFIAENNHEQMPTLEQSERPNADLESEPKEFSDAEPASEPTYEIVAVGADWSTNENILGYPDALHPTRYIRTQALDLILRSIENPRTPHFLILDEMNLSHVERYFADILSSIESGEPIHLYSDSPDDIGALRDGVPHSVKLPENLFIVGTVNIDETTYMFSPKVLDRANTIEFRVIESQLAAFLNNPTDLNIAKIRGKGEHFASAFLKSSKDQIAKSDSEFQTYINSELMLLFNVMAHYGYEFGYRTAVEISRFIYHHQRLGDEQWSVNNAIDTQVYQKILPRLNGSRAKLEPVLRSLSVLCRAERKWSSTGDSSPVLENREEILSEAKTAAGSTHTSTDYDQDSGISALEGMAIYPLSHAKLQRMSRLLRQNGFTSFAEA